MSDISHIGIAVADLEKAVEAFSAILGYPPSSAEVIADQKVRVAMFASRDDPHSGHIELLEATADDSPIKRFIDERGPGLHHLAILVDDIEATLTYLKAKGFRLIDESPRVGTGGKKIAFIHPASTNGVLLELQER
ncbi:MAG: methylmalonyl-CoA epimerase [Candidatus Zixiibacteriota bacterium]|nr:MAG: methylmalonyl-CoA epimerase [candidate division Zixibacteria bacterium]